MWFSVPVRGRISARAFGFLSINDDRYTSEVVVPFIVLLLLFLKRRELAAKARYSLGVGLPIAIAGIAIAIGARSPHERNLTVAICGVVIVWLAGFLAFFGPGTARIARFPISILFPAVPLPARALDYVTTALLNSSARTSAVLFRAIGVAIPRQGLVCPLPGFGIRIAQQCSGIRSSISLVIGSGLAAYLFLGMNMHRLPLASVTVPLVTPSTRAFYVNQGFLYGSLHHYGGLCFSLLDLAIIVPLLLKFHKTEARTPAPSDEGLVVAKC